MQLLSVSNQGVVEFEGIENTFEEELSLKLDEDLDNVQLTLAYLKAQGLVETNNNEYLLVDACNNIGSECDSAKRVREFREKKNKVLQCNESVTEVLQNSISISNSNSISNIKEEKEVKHKYGEYKNVLLKDSELIKLKQDHPNWEELIKCLDEYIEMKGAKYKSHYLAIKKWVVSAVREYKLNTNNKNGKQATKTEYTKEQLNDLFDNIEDVEI